MTLPRTAADVLSRHVVFEIESIDRLYLNVYVPELQRVGQVVGFLTRHLGFEIASTALVAKRSEAFVAGLQRYAADHGVPLIDFVKGVLDTVRTSMSWRRGCARMRRVCCVWWRLLSC